MRLILFIFLLCSCAIAPKVKINHAYDSQQVKKILSAKGTSTINGSAFLKRNDGIVVTCAGAQVILILETEYAKSRVEYLYGHGDKGYNPYIGKNATFDPEIADYHNDQKTSICDAQGKFKFQNVPEGTYYVIATVMWNAGYAQQGGRLMSKISLSKNQELEIIMSHL